VNVYDCSSHGATENAHHVIPCCTLHPYPFYVALATNNIGITLLVQKSIVLTYRGDHDNVPAAIAPRPDTYAR
jgi:hypothetical protein